ncbi:unnamed protein product [Caenorhabditis brenneri]
MVDGTLIVAEPAEKEVIYSTLSSDDGQIVVQVSASVALRTGPGAPGADTETVKKNLDASLDILKGCLKLGTFAFPPAAPILMAVSGVASFIQSVMKFIPDNKEDPIQKKLNEIQKTITELEKQMNAKFDDLKSFITESHFTVDILAEASKLIEFLNDVLQHPNEETIKIFENVYRRNTPLSLAYKVMSLLDQESTNPLVMAMKMSSEKFLFIEAFACGLFKDENLYSCERLKERQAEMNEAIENWEDAYKKDETYWKDLKERIEKYMNSHALLDNKGRADGIKKILDGYLTHDAFFIVVHDFILSNKHDRRYIKTRDDQLLKLSFNREVEVLIYRSKEANKKKQEDIDVVRKEIKRLKAQQYIKKEMVINLDHDDLKDNTGMMALIGDLREEVRVANYKKKGEKKFDEKGVVIEYEDDEDGPGWYTYYKDFGGPVEQRLIGGYR